MFRYFLAALTHCADGDCGFAVGVFVHLGLRGTGTEKGFGVVHCCVLGQGGAGDGAVERPSDEASPEEHAHGHEP